MPYADLRDFLNKLDRCGKLHRIGKPVDKDWEIAAVTKAVFEAIPEPRRPALLFERVAGFDIPVVVGALGASRAIYCLALECEIGKVYEKWAEAERCPVPPKRLSAGPVHENVLRDDEVDLRRLPIPTWTVGEDPGPYITSGCVITRDPESGIRNVGTYRVQLKGPRKLGLFINYLQGGREHVEKNNRLGRATPVAIVVGADPVIGLVSVTRLPKDLDELAVAGALRGAPVEVVRCVTSDLEVPATAEFVIEGAIAANQLEDEGPFGEYTGYMGPRSMSYVVDVECLAHRTGPVFQALTSQMPPSESSCIRSIGRESALKKHLAADLGLPVVDVHLFEAGGSAAYLVISMKKSHPAHPRIAMCGAWAFAPQFGKITVVVDDDIDVRDPDSVNWALAFRVQPDRDTFVMSGTAAVQLDPSQAPEDVLQQDPSRRLSSKLGIDATRKHPFPAVAAPPREHLDRVLREWKNYGF
ncbi:MAG TPA: UbiD family decarboxylase [candidate division Zixibacteria bacterium]|nr:UbiD family decarboxylase [candidate division Zixibacteria bacterium]